MASYRGTEGNDRAKALAAVVAVHIALGAAILTGLNVETVTRAVDRLKTFDIREVPPPPPPEPPPKPDESSAPKDKAAPANIKSKPTPVVAPPPRMPPPIPLPINAAKVAGPEGIDRTAGAAATPGSGTGAGGQGNGFGGGGTGGAGNGSGSGFTPAQRITKIPDSEYRLIRSVSGQRSGRIGITLKVNTDGSASNCRIARTSGSQAVDSLFCDLAVRYVRFKPARDPQGRPVAQDISWFPDWSPR